MQQQTLHRVAFLNVASSADVAAVLQAIKEHVAALAGCVAQHENFSATGRPSACASARHHMVGAASLARCQRASGAGKCGVLAAAAALLKFSEHVMATDITPEAAELHANVVVVERAAVYSTAAQLQRMTEELAVANTAKHNSA